MRKVAAMCRHVVLPVPVLLRQRSGHGLLLGQRGHSVLTGDTMPWHPTDRCFLIVQHASDRAECGAGRASLSRLLYTNKAMPAL